MIWVVLSMVLKSKIWTMFWWSVTRQGTFDIRLYLIWLFKASLALLSITGFVQTYRTSMIDVRPSKTGGLYLVLHVVCFGNNEMPLSLVETLLVWRSWIMMCLIWPSTLFRPLVSRLPSLATVFRNRKNSSTRLSCPIIKWRSTQTGRSVLVATLLVQVRWIGITTVSGLGGTSGFALFSRWNVKGPCMVLA